jgi:hypothetical protein
MRIAPWLVMLGLTVSAVAQQTDNQGLHAPPAPAGKPIVIDGKLDDWDLSGQVLMCYDLEALADTFSARTAMMHDADALYVSVHWKDATPLGNSHDPRYTADRGWAGDCLQLRVRTDKITHVTAWYHAATKAPTVHLSMGVGLNKAFGGGDKVLHHTEGWKLQEGVEMAFLADADGKGYVQELKLPWSMICNEKRYAAGDSVACGFELLWGEGDWPVHRYADNLAVGASSREFFFTAVNNWGLVKLEPTGNLKLPEPAYVTAARQAEGQGPIAIAYTLPRDARVTLAIDDSQGRRVRNLIAARPRKAGANIEHWDGLDDNGRLVAPGEYRYRTLYHDGIHVNYVMSFASPGNPSWDTPDGTGAFYGDHSPAIAAAAAGKFVALMCPIGEAGKHLIGVDLTGQRRWGLHNRLYADGIDLATDGKTLYIVSYLPSAKRDRENGRTFVWRCELATGKFSPWSRKDASGKDVLDLDLLPQGPADACRGIDLRDGKLAVLMATQQRVLILDGKTGDTLGEITGIPADCTAISYMADGNLAMTAGAALHVLDLGSGQTRPLAQGLVEPFGLTCDIAGNLYVSQRGSAQNVAVFDAAGKKLREIGVSGGRPGHGPFLDGGMRQPGRPAIDSQGRLWVPEFTFNPKRTSVWNTDGQLVTDFIGTTHYSASGAINPHDPTMAFSDGTVFRIDLAQGTSRPVYSIGPRNLPDEIFQPNFGARVRIVKHGNDTLVYDSDRSGVVYCTVLHDGQWRIASAVGVVQKLVHNEISVDFLHPLMAGHVGEMFSWADQNGDGLVQSDELAFGQVMHEGKPVKIRWCYWGVLPQTDGTVVYFSPDLSALVKLPIAGYTPAAAPRYDLAKARVVKLPADDGDSKAFRDISHLMGGSDGRVILNQNPLTIVDDQGRIIGRYPSTTVSVHGSHNALSSRPGYLIGPLTVLGTADLGGEVGEIFSLNGNLGENYLFTSDGLWIQSLFKDTRGVFDQPGKAVRGMPMDAISAGGESFGGQFMRTPEGKVCLQIGNTDARVLEVTGLDTIRRLNGSFRVEGAQIAAANQLAQERAAAAKQTKLARVPRTTAVPQIDGKFDDWAELKAPDDARDLVEIRESPTQRFGRVALRYDDQCLYVAWRVWGSGSLRNAGQDERQLFKTGDCVDLMLGPVGGKGEGNLRLLVSKLASSKDLVAVVYRKHVPGTPEAQRVGFSSPWRTITFDQVQRVSEVKAATGSYPAGFAVEAAIPWSVLGVQPRGGLKLRGDLGVLGADSGGTTTISRRYWCNKSTGLVNDVPGEADLTPDLWGEFELQ